MAGFSQGSRSSLSFGVQSDFVTPATAPFTALPFKTHSLDLSKERLEGQDIQSDRMPRIDRHGNRNAAGSVDIDLRKGDYDDLIESVMLNTFDGSNELRVGTTPKFLTIEDAAEDISQYRLYTGMAANSMSVSVVPNQMVETTFELVGRDMVQSGASSAGAVNPSSTNAPYDSYNGALFEGGTTAGDIISLVTSIDFSITNSFAPTFVVGSDVAPHLEYGRAVVEGTITAYYKDDALINKFLNEVETELQVTVDDPSGANPMTFYFPRVKFNGSTVPVANEQSRTIEIPFVSLYDTTANSNLVITRTP